MLFQMASYVTPSSLSKAVSPTFNQVLQNNLDEFKAQKVNLAKAALKSEKKKENTKTDSATELPVVEILEE